MTCACPTIVWRTTYSPAGKSTVPTLTGAVGIHEMSRVTFVALVKVGTVDLPAGEYVVRHTMVVHAHVMVCLRVHSKDEFEVKCTLVPLTQNADKDQSIYLSAARSGKR